MRGKIFLKFRHICCDRGVITTKPEPDFVEGGAVKRFSLLDDLFKKYATDREAIKQLEHLDSRTLVYREAREELRKYFPED